MTAETQAERSRIRRLLDIVISSPRAFVDLSGCELDLAIRVARRVRLIGRLGAKLEAAGLLDALPTHAADQIRSSMAMADARSRLALWELDRIAWAMGADKSTPLVAMKGCTYLLRGLPNSPGRIFADVDLMTSEGTIEAVERRLNEMGWESSKLTPYDQNYYRKWTHELPPLIHHEREVEVDLHHNILPRTGRLKPPSAKLMASTLSLRNSRYRVLADEDVVLHAMVHLMFDSDLADKLRDLVDIHELIEYFSGRKPDFLRLLMDRAAELGLERPVYYSIRYANSYLGLPLPRSASQQLDRFAPPSVFRWLMDRLVPRALYPTHPDRQSAITSISRLCLYVRSHWIRMPPWLLAYHLTYKFIATRLSPSDKGN